MIKKWVVIVLVVGCVALFAISRSPLIIDDVHPAGGCDSMTKQGEVLYVIPFQGNDSIADHQEWCESLKGKKVGMHGLQHTYREFEGEVSRAELAEGVDAFQQCVGEEPVLFRPPHNAISIENEQLVDSFGMELYKEDFFSHPYCVCEPENVLWKISNFLLMC